MWFTSLIWEFRLVLRITALHRDFPEFEIKHNAWSEYALSLYRKACGYSNGLEARPLSIDTMAERLNGLFTLAINQAIKQRSASSSALLLVINLHLMSQRNQCRRKNTYHQTVTVIRVPCHWGNTFKTRYWSSKAVPPDLKHNLA